MILRKFCFFLFALGMLSSCTKDSKVKNSVPIQTDILILGHKGSGNNVYNEVYLENTLPSIRHAVSKLDGVEVDVQMSKDGTLWIWHDSDLEQECNADDYRCLITRTDAEISALQICHQNKRDRIYRLSELIDFWNSPDGNFYMSLEVKSSFPTDTFNAVGGKDLYMKTLGQNMAALLQTFNHQNKIFVELNYKPLITEFKKFNSNKVFFCLLDFQDIGESVNSAISKGYDGISINYRNASVNPTSVADAKLKGMVVQVYTPYYISDLEYALSLNPTTIQTDNVDAKTDLNIE